MIFFVQGERFVEKCEGPRLSQVHIHSIIKIGFLDITIFIPSKNMYFLGFNIYDFFFNLLKILIIYVFSIFNNKMPFQWNDISSILGIWKRTYCLLFSFTNPSQINNGQCAVDKISLDLFFKIFSSKVFGHIFMWNIA